MQQSGDPDRTGPVMRTTRIWAKKRLVQKLVVINASRDMVRHGLRPRLDDDALSYLHRTRG